MELSGGVRDRGSGRKPGGVRSVGDATPTGSFEQISRTAGGELLVSGRPELARTVASMLEDLHPPIRVRELARGAELPAHANAEAVLAEIDHFDDASLDWIRRVVADFRKPLILVVTRPVQGRSALRMRARELGVLDCLLGPELSSALLEAVVTHARTHNAKTARLAEQRERFALAVRGSRDGMWEWDVARGRVHYSQRWRELLGLRGSELVPSLDAWLARVHPEDLPRLRADLEAVEQGLAAVHENEHRIRDGVGDWRWVRTRAVVHRDEHDRVVRMAGSLTDLTPYRRRERALREQSRHDALTKLPDRRVFLERVARAVELGRAHGDYAFVVLLVAVDRLGQIRDSFGLEVADQVFAILAQRLRSCLRPEDHLFRFSSSKFAILIEDVEGPTFGTDIANRIHDAMAEPFEVDGAASFTTVSIGMTSSAHGYTRVEEVVADVSAATDSARDRGRNRHEIYDASMRVESRALLALEMALRKALDTGQLQLHYQPIVRVLDRSLLGFEALLRWNHPDRGLVSPAEFIPLAESTGLIVPIGRWVLREAVRHLHGWHEEFGTRDLAVSVNLSAKQIGDPLLLETLDSALAETGLPPSSLKLELTESFMLDRVEEVTALLQDIRSRGVRIWVDDFGTGYSSLGYLHRFPVDGLKIDRTFVSELDGTPASATLVRTILSLAENLGLEVVAEGIETEDHARQLQELGCTWCQGWLFGKPQPAIAVRRMLG